MFSDGAPGHLGARVRGEIAQDTIRALLTFSNIEGIDVVIDQLQTLRANMVSGADATTDRAPKCDDPGFAVMSAVYEVIFDEMADDVTSRMAVGKLGAVTFDGDCWEVRDAEARVGNPELFVAVGSFLQNKGYSVDSVARAQRDLSLALDGLRKASATDY